MVYVIQTAIELGFMYALVAMALFLSYRILDIADLTTDSGCSKRSVTSLCTVDLEIPNRLAVWRTVALWSIM